MICHEIYQAARELVNSRVPTTQLTSASKCLWGPDLHPRLVEYVADFARCGDRALGTFSTARPRDGHAPRLGAVTSLRAKPLRASRLILFRVYYLGGAEYEAARHLLGISQRTWSDWAEEVRARVGSELIRAGMCPPARYFRQPSVRPIAPPSSTKSAPEAKMTAVPREPDFD